jgi:hypothetical protein
MSRGGPGKPGPSLQVAIGEGQKNEKKEFTQRTRKAQRARRRKEGDGHGVPCPYDGKRQEETTSGRGRIRVGTF